MQSQILTQNQSVEETKRLASADGLAELKSKLGPVAIVQGLQPYTEGERGKDVVDQRPVADRPVQQVSGIDAFFVKERTLFTLAPLYCTLGITFDLTSQFAGTALGKGAELLKLGVPVRIIEDIPGWENIVEAIDREHWNQFVEFMCELMFNKGPNYWTVCGDFVDVPVQGANLRIAVFTPRTMVQKLRPWVDNLGVIRFSIENADDAYLQNSYTRKIALLLDNKE